MTDLNKKAIAATHVALISSDSQFREMVANTFSSQLQISLESFEGDLTQVQDSALAGATVIVVDLDAGSEEQIAAGTMVHRPAQRWPWWALVVSGAVFTVGGVVREAVPWISSLACA